MSRARRIILDCDPGHDDALAIMLAHGTPEIEICAITTVAGNHPLQLTTLNALRVCSLAGIRGVPVAAGCETPLLRELGTAPEIHGEAGLEGYSWAQPSLSAVPEHAVDLIIGRAADPPGGERAGCSATTPRRSCGRPGSPTRRCTIPAPLPGSRGRS